MFSCSKRLHIWEGALMMALALTLLCGGWAGAQQAALAEGVLRLHVVANSDSARDQALKLRVRDAVLAQAQPLLEGAQGREEAQAALQPHLEQLGQAAEETLRQSGCGDRVEVMLTDEWFPTKTYDGFALPPGNYRALKVVIGQGRGQNWWCVVFPPLCLACVTEETAAAAVQGGLTRDQAALITGRDGSYVLKFRTIEWWETLMRKQGR